jgi:hypothetical protein
MCPVQLESSIIVVEGGRSPRVGGVALGAVLAELSAVRISLRVTDAADLGGALEYTAEMTGGTVYGNVRTGQFKGGFVMIEVGGFPGTGDMALSAIVAKLALMGVIIFVAGTTVLGCAFIAAIDVAQCALHRNMRPGQREGELIVVNRDMLPVTGIVAGAAVLCELTVVFVILLVAGRAIQGCANEDAIEVAFVAGHRHVFANQLEGELTVIGVDFVPGVGIMAGAAVLHELPVVFIVFLMAGRAIHGCALEDTILVAVGAGNLLVFAGQFELGEIVIELGGLPAFRGVAIGASGA